VWCRPASDERTSQLGARLIQRSVPSDPSTSLHKLPIGTVLIDYDLRASARGSNKGTKNFVAMAKMDSLPSEIIFHISRCKCEYSSLSELQNNQRPSSRSTRHCHSPARQQEIPRPCTRRFTMARTMLQQIILHGKPSPPSRIDSSGTYTRASFPGLSKGFGKWKWLGRFEAGEASGGSAGLQHAIE